jgi:hypothetical protein
MAAGPTPDRATSRITAWMVRENKSQHRRPDLSSGLPSTAQNPSTVEGRNEQAGKIAPGLRATRRGWRRTVLFTGAALVILGVLAVVVAMTTSR